MLDIIASTLTTERFNISYFTNRRSVNTYRFDCTINIFLGTYVALDYNRLKTIFWMSILDNVINSLFVSFAHPSGFWKSSWNNEITIK